MTFSSATLASRPYSEKLDEVLADLAAVLGEADHPLLAEREEGGKRLIVLITTDRGLAGPLNTNTIRFASREILDHPGDLTVVTVGRKGRDAMRRAGVPLEAHFAGFGDRPTFADVIPLRLVGIGEVISLGDIFLALGLGVFLEHELRRPRRYFKHGAQAQPGSANRPSPP